MQHKEKEALFLRLLSMQEKRLELYNTIFSTIRVIIMIIKNYW